MLIHLSQQKIRVNQSLLKLLSKCHYDHRVICFSFLVTLKFVLVYIFVFALEGPFLTN